MAWTRPARGRTIAPRSDSHVRRRPVRAGQGPRAGHGPAVHRYSPGVSQNRLAAPVRAVLSSPGPRRRRRTRDTTRSPDRILGKSSTGAKANCLSERARPRPRSATVENATHQPSSHTAGSHRRMDAKQVWRAALGELQVSLSPANFETWLRDTQLVDVDEQRFRIAVPNGFAKDWLESRYRSLISQTLARIVGYSVQVEFVIGATPENPADGQAAPVGAAAVMAPRPKPARTGPGTGRPLGSRSGSSRRGSAARAGRPTSTRATPSPTSSSARPTGWPTRRACRSRSVRATPTTRSSCTAAWASARPT